MPEIKESVMTKPNIPSCFDSEAHNFMPIGKKHVYCTRCAANVKFTTGKDKK